MVRFCAAYLALGFPLAFPKAQLADCVTWIGVTLRVGTGFVEASIPVAKLDDILSLITQALAANVITVKELRQLAGKAMSVASLLITWRPFLAQF